MIKEKEIMKKGFMVVLLVLLAGAMVFAEEPQKLTVKLEVVSTDWYGFTDSKIEDFTTDLPEGMSGDKEVSGGTAEGAGVPLTYNGGGFFVSAVTNKADACDLTLTWTDLEYKDGANVIDSIRLTITSENGDFTVTTSEKKLDFKDSTVVSGSAGRGARALSNEIKLFANADDYANATATGTDESYQAELTLTVTTNV